MSRELTLSTLLGEMSGMDKDLLEVVLNNSTADFKIKRIIDMKLESPLPKGENYTSNIFRVKLKVVLGNGRIVTKSFIMKKEIVNGGEPEFFKKQNLTKSEVSIYTNVLREMDYLMEDFQDTEGPLWCKLIYYNLSDSIVILEDLKVLGFETVKRTVLQDIDHARLALRGLGRYHAMAKVLEDRGIVSIDGYRPFPFLYEETMIKSVVYGAIRALIKGMKATWGEEWAETADKLNQLSFEELLKRIQSDAKFDENIFKCLNHGDCWNNNMMFKYNWEGKPIEIRLVDFQAPHYNTPCVDVAYFMYTSIRPHLRRQHYKLLVELYHESLTSCLDRFGYKGTKPSLKEIEDTLERLSYFSLALFSGTFATEISKRTDAFDVKKVFETGGEEGFNLNIYSEDGVIEQTGEEIKKFLKILGY